ncbi:hypothetical protein FA95DRAFT_1578834, partial [Auriscalpium vulgare]
METEERVTQRLEPKDYLRMRLLSGEHAQGVQPSRGLQWQQSPTTRIDSPRMDHGHSRMPALATYRPLRPLHLGIQRLRAIYPASSLGDLACSERPPHHPNRSEQHGTPPSHAKCTFILAHLERTNALRLHTAHAIPDALCGAAPILHTLDLTFANEVPSNLSQPPALVLGGRVAPALAGAAPCTHAPLAWTSPALAGLVSLDVSQRARVELAGMLDALARWNTLRWASPSISGRRRRARCWRTGRRAAGSPWRGCAACACSRAHLSLRADVRIHCVLRADWRTL